MGHQCSIASYIQAIYLLELHFDVCDWDVG